MLERESKYTELAQQAMAMAEEDNAHRDAFRLKCKDNMSLYFFLRRVPATRLLLLPSAVQTFAESMHLKHANAHDRRSAHSSHISGSP